MRADLLDLVQAIGRRTSFEAELADIDRMESEAGRSFARRRLPQLSDDVQASIRACSEKRAARVRERFPTSELEKIDHQVKIQRQRLACLEMRLGELKTFAVAGDVGKQFRVAGEPPNGASELTKS